jgi:hypothetical protein
VPQKPQRRNLAGFSSPHEGHVTISRVYAGLRGFLGRTPGRRRDLESTRPHLTLAYQQLLRMVNAGLP